MRRHRALAASLILCASQARGQQVVHRIGVLSNAENPEMMQAWLEGLRERGYVVGRNLQMEYRYSQALTERIPALVAELVALGPEVIVANATHTGLTTETRKALRQIPTCLATPAKAGAHFDPGSRPLPG